jgi:putative exosortase-associated protein (TIGR04073 family)
MRLTRIVLAFLVVSLVAPSFARGPFYPESVPARASRKFARGFLNTVFFWAEIPKEVNRDWQNIDPLTGVFTGTGKGLYKGAQRFGAGIYEMATFPVDRPAKYQPIVYPEVVLEDGYDWGAEEYYHEHRTSRFRY